MQCAKLRKDLYGPVLLPQTLDYSWRTTGKPPNFGLDLNFNLLLLVRLPCGKLRQKIPRQLQVKASLTCSYGTDFSDDLDFGLGRETLRVRALQQEVFFGLQPENPLEDSHW